eukprot:scaffold9806_cov145-Amphora_coffeaeformis.AAC.4
MPPWEQKVCPFPFDSKETWCGKVAVVVEGALDCDCFVALFRILRGSDYEMPGDAVATRHV